MVGFLTLLFFSFTGITLNHPTWFGGEAAHTINKSGTLPIEWLASSKAESSNDENSVDQLRIAEALREENQLRGKVVEFRVSDDECSVTFKGPGYSADALIDRADGKYDVTIVAFGLIGKWNDLHKGRDSGWIWSLVIDASAILMILSSLSGLGMLLFLKRKRASGLWTTLIGALLFILFYFWFVP